MTPIEILARAVVQREGHLLLTKRTGSGYAFLPGGHVESGEPVRRALIREMQEELGLPIEIGRFLSVIEHTYERDGAAIHEINFLFECQLPSAPFPADPASIEPDFTFWWERIDGLPESELLPITLRERLAPWLFSPIAGHFVESIV